MTSAGNETVKYQIEGLKEDQTYSWYAVTKDAAGNTTMTAPRSFKTADPTVVGIEVTKAPNRTTYEEGETFSSEGMVVNAVYSDGSRKEITDYTVNLKGALKLEDTAVVITWNGITTQIAISVRSKATETPEDNDKPEDNKDNDSTQKDEVTDSNENTVVTTEKATQIQMAKATVGKTSAKLTWNKINGADGYLIYGAKCGKSYKLLKKVSAKTQSYTKKKLAKGTSYKFYVVAYKTVNGKRKTITKTPAVHVVTKGGKYGNPTAVTVNKKAVTVNKGKTVTVKASVSKVNGKAKYHIPAIRYRSTNKKVATVSSKGKIKGVNKGSCYVYCYAPNGIYKKVKVTVK